MTVYRTGTDIQSVQNILTAGSGKIRNGSEAQILQNNITAGSGVLLTGSEAELLAIPPVLVASGLLLEYLFNEGSGTVLGDSSGNGFNGTLGLTGSFLPTWNSKGLAFNVSYLQMPLTSALWSNALTTMIFADNIPSASTPQTLLSLDGNSAVGPQLTLREGTGQLLFQSNSAAPSFMSGIALKGPNVVSVTCGNPRALYWNGNPITQVVQANNLSGAYTPYVPSSSAYLGSQGATFYVGTMSLVLMYNRVLSAAEIAQNVAWGTNLLALRGVTIGDTTTNLSQIIFLGDSLTAGVNATYQNQYATYVMSSLSGSYNWRNFGIGGDTIANMITRGTNTIDPLINLWAATPKVCVIWGGRNDIANASSAATVYGNLQTIGAARKAAGWKVIMLTPIVGVDITAGAKETARASVRASLLADAPTARSGNVFSGATYADFTVDVAAEVHLQDYTNATYFAGDEVHLTDAGYEIVGGPNNVKAALNLCGVT
jgi:lysophospholipase L1-like esterase